MLVCLFYNLEIKGIFPSLILASDLKRTTQYQVLFSISNSI